MNYTAVALVVLPLTPVLFSVLFTELFYKSADREKKEKIRLRYRQTLLCFSIVLGWFYFFNDKEILFECRKETRRCDYSRSTVFKPELRFVKSYDFTQWTNIELKSFKKRRGRYSTRTAYKIVFHKGETTEEFPKTFDYKGWAEEETGKLNRFLTTKKKRYVYKTGRADSDPFSDGIRYSFLITSSVWLCWFLRAMTRKDDNARED